MLLRRCKGVLMFDQESVLNWVYSACDAVNRDLPDEEKIEKSKDTVLHGDESNVDSLSLINLMMEVESAVEKESGKRVSLLNADAFNSGRFTTIETFSNYVAEQVNKP
jgi:acyl carrier protein